MSVDTRCNHKFIDSNHCLKCGWSPEPKADTKRARDLANDNLDYGCGCSGLPNADEACFIHNIRAVQEIIGKLADEVDQLREDYAKIVHANAEVGSLNVGLQLEVDRLNEKLLQAVDFIDFKHRPLLAAAKAEHLMHCREGHYTAQEAGNCPKLHGVVADECSVCKAIAACEEKP